MIGEDSGLEVDGLGGRPGIFSARYAGPVATDEENVAKLLAELEGVTGDGRRARYVSELVCLSPGSEELRGRGTLEGAIALAPRGAEGFGYDPVFVPAGETLTVAELGNDWKARAEPPRAGGGAPARGSRQRRAGSVDSAHAAVSHDDKATALGRAPLFANLSRAELVAARQG